MSLTPGRVQDCSFAYRVGRFGVDVVILEWSPRNRGSSAVSDVAGVHRPPC